MTASISFTRRKFLRLNLQQQHKKCSQILRAIYLTTFEKTDPKPLWEIYQTYLEWMKIAPFESCDKRLIADRYHWHLSEAALILKEHNLLPHIRKGDHVPKEPFAPCAIYLDHVRSAYNVGSILRTVEALRTGEVYFSPDTPFINNDKVRKISMGAFDYVPCHQNIALEQLPQPLIVVDTSDDAIALHEFLFPKSFTLIFGNEEYGVSENALKKADIIIEIPLYGAKNSINVACAFSCVAAEIRRQKSMREYD